MDTQFRAQPGAPEVYVRRVLQARDASAIDEMSQVQIQYNPAYQSVTLNGVRILRKDETLDRTESSGVRLIEREEQLEARIYSGIVLLAILVEDLRVGDTLDVEYTLHGQNPVFQGRYLEYAIFSSPVPVGHRRVRLSSPEGRRLQHKLHRLDLRPRETVSGGWRETVWEARNLPPTRNEGQYPRWYNPYAWLQITEFPSWGEVAKWAAELYAEKSDDSGTVQERVERFRKAGATDEERTLAALQFVQEEIRYFAISFGESSHRPARPEETLRRRLGDCKDKTLLLVTLLQKLGVPAKPALVSMGYGKGIEDFLPSPVAFDHVITIATIGGKEYWLDATLTSQRGALRQRTQLDVLGKALIAEASRDALTDITRASDAVVDSIEVTEEFSVAEFERPATLTITTAYSGGRAERMRNVIARVRRDEVTRLLFDDLARRYPKAKTLKPHEVQDDAVENRLVVVERYEVPDFIERVNDLWIGRYYSLLLDTNLRLPATVQRTGPLSIDHPLQLKYAFEVRLPQEVSVMQEPASRTVRNAYFEFTETRRFRGNVVNGLLEYRSRADSVPPDAVEKVIPQMKFVRESLFRQVSVPVRLPAQPAVAGGANLNTLEEKLRARDTEIMRRIDLVIASNRLTGSDLAEAYFRRALSHSHLENYDSALADLNKAIEVDPVLARAYVERGILQTHLGSYERALRDFGEGLTLGAAADDVYYRRGHALYYMRRYDQAAAEFKRAVETASDPERVPFYLLWYAWSAKRSGTPMDAQLEQRIRAEAARKEWPRPALGLFVGLKTPEEVLKATQAGGNPEEQQMNLCEALYYVGQYYLAAGDRDKARDAFRRARATGAISYLEYVYSKKELALLGQ